MNEMLTHSELFHNVSAGAVAELAATAERVTYARGHVVFREGEVGDRLYILTAGMVKIGHTAADGRETLVAVLGPPDMFGELALFDPGPRTSTVTALTTIRAVVMDRATVTPWIAEHPEAAEQLLRTLARRLRRTHDQVCDLIFTDVPGRVAKNLLALARRFGHPDGALLRVNHELTQEEIAQLVGASRETVNKALADFADRGWIRVKGKSIVITDPARLAQRAR